MVTQDSPPHHHPDTTNILHQFITTQTQFDHHHHHHRHHHHHHQSHQHFDGYGGNGFRGNSSDSSVFGHSSLGLLPNSIQSLGGEESAQMSHTRRLMDLLGETTTSSSNDNAAQQRLSLSLNSHNFFVPPNLHNSNNNYRPQIRDLIANPNPNYSISVDDHHHQDDGDYSFSGPASVSRQSVNLYGAISGSRYLRPTQSLLEQIVSVGGREIDLSNEKFAGNLFRGGGRRGGSSLSSELRAEFCSTGIVSADKQEAQMKLAKLISLLEEVENRYEKYYQQMEEVMSTFEEIAGRGTAKSYTALALQAMSRHFCSLRDAVVSRINVERRKLAQDLPKISAGLSQLSLFDGRDQPKSARISLQQLGLIQSHQRQAWRPIRGLPETSVAILRAWLFEHFLHPYPNDSEKLMLASQTGLSKNQVSNWFINARVRLWKPMIEEMYKEEFGDSSEDCGSLANEGVSVTDHDQDD